MIFHAYASRLVYEEEGKMRSGIEFEAIPEQKLSAFLKKNKRIALESQNEAYQSLVNLYLEQGTDSEEFQREKVKYFGAGDDIYYLTVWFNYPAEAEQIVLTGWYVIAPGLRFEYQISPIMNVELVEYGACTIYQSSSDEQTILDELMMAHSIEGTSEQTSRDKKGDMLRAIDQNTVFYSACVYYVGAALCVALNSARDSLMGYWLPNRTEAYFDFGYASGAASGNAYVRNNSPKAVANLALIVQDLVNSPQKVVFISHWHQDHVNLIAQINGDARFNPFWAQSTWIVPETASPVHTVVANNLLAHGGALHVLYDVFPSPNPVYNIGNNPNLIFGKIDAFSKVDAHGNISAAGIHPHHHGIYARVNLTEIHDLGVQSMLLAGDCTYEGIPVAQKNGCAFLQVCHHGGDYSLAPCTQNQNVNRMDIPDPLASPAYRYAIYSANGVTYGHPNANVMGRHIWKGWTASRETYLAVNGRYYVGYDGVYDL